MVKAKKYILDKYFSGLPKSSDLRLEEEELPPLKNGEFLAEAVYLSVDPYMRAYAEKLPLGIVFIGSQVAKVVESKSDKYPVGKYVVGEFGWRSHTISNGAKNDIGFPAPWILPDLQDLPLSLGLGMLGMPGNTSYFGFLEICQPKPGETVVVSGAGGAVGSHVGQIAKLKGCKVVGIAGDDKKGEWLTKELGFDHFINYKKPDLATKLAECAPNGIDCYFDNVGGEISSIVLSQMNSFGRVSVCGSITDYNSDSTNMPKATIIQRSVVGKQLKIEGFIVHRWAERWQEGIQQNLKWIKEGKLKYKETVTEGFENMFKAFVDMLEGGNTGKAVVKVIIESRHKDFPVGKHVVGKFNWRTHTICTETTGAADPPAGHSPYIIPDFGQLPLSYALGVLGIPGTTAYFGFLEKCRPKAGETVVITGAAGAVGSIVGQTAKIKGCKVVGITGSDSKGKYLVEELGFDAYINYKSKDMEEQLVMAVPQGIDCYFDNVAGEISTIVMKHMNMFGRISVCGSISSYNADSKTPPKVSCVQLHMLLKQLKIESFQVYLYYDRTLESIHQNMQWVKEGKLRYAETITEGFENMTKAFIEMLDSKNTGKALVKM